MSREPDFVRKKFAPLLDKTLKNALAYRIGKEFPRLGGPRILALCAEMILEIIHQHIRPRESVTHGQVLWMGTSINDPPSRAKRIADTKLVPVVLELSTPEDIEAILDRQPPKQRLLSKVIRLCDQAYRQGALLSNCDLAALLNLREDYIAEKWGIYFTQVTPRCSIAFHGGLSAKSGRIRSPLLHREGMPGVFGPASVAGWFSLSTMRGAEGVVGE